MKPAIYIASSFDTRERLSPVRDRLRTCGYAVTSRWLDEAPDVSYRTATEDYHRRCAVWDIEDISSSDWLILDTIDEAPRGGREVELGVALAQRAHWGFPQISIVGPLRNVFHRLADQHFDSWEDFFASTQ